MPPNSTNFTIKATCASATSLPSEEIDGLCQRIDQIMLGEVRYDNMLMQLCPSAGNPELSRQTKEFKGSSLKYRKIQDLEQDPLFLDYMQKPLFRDLTAKIVSLRRSRSFAPCFSTSPPSRAS